MPDSLPPAGPEAFDRAFILEPLADGAIVVSLRSGDIATLNASAAFIWEQRRLGMAPAEIAAALVHKWPQLDRDEAASHVADTLRDDLGGVLPRATTPYRYVAVVDGYDYWFDERPLFKVLDAGRRVRLLDRSEAPSGRLTSHVWTLVPKLMSLLGVPVLHGSAVAYGGFALAFTGVSGAGKTTTARLLAKVKGWQLLSEDKIVFSARREGIVVSTEGEPRLKDFIREAGRAFASGADEIDCRPLCDLTVGPSALLEILVVLHEGARRVGATDVQLRPLSQVECAREILPQMFLGTPDPQGVRAQITWFAELARGTTSALMLPPAGLRPLETALASHSW